MKTAIVFLSLITPLLGYADSGNERVFYQLRVSLSGQARCDGYTKPACNRFETLEARRGEGSV
jgi:hypothetical protein